MIGTDTPVRCDNAHAFPLTACYDYLVRVGAGSVRHDGEAGRRPRQILDRNAYNNG
ncbi:hypothetical protein [Janthinobacterium sp.]|uniref:hypothetical protein n=1 Tax=Janthinobacterium sp. TaxID=1871054 RepID=UPI002585591A|nr:hypothetical protein [Janthinobacterium sp.]MCX7291886.1 hypothetical protein [Janthinobacterium sp.]